MTIINALFIGGVKDGQWMAVEEFMSRIDFPIFRPLKLLKVGEAPEADVPITTRVETYETIQLGGEKERFTVYRLQGMTGDDAIAALIDGYKKCD